MSESNKDKGHYNSERKGYETKDGGLIRIHGDSEIRIDIYSGNERTKGGHTRDTIKYDTKTGKGRIEQHNEDKTDKSSTDTSCYLTTACMRYFQEKFNDDCYELRVLRWFRDNFVSKEDIEHYYEVAPLIVDTIEKEENNNLIYDYIYDNVIDYCVEQIEEGFYDKAYSRYKNSILSFEEQFINRNGLVKKLQLIR